jgi:hypothetical protein
MEIGSEMIKKMLKRREECNTYLTHMSADVSQVGVAFFPCF